MSPERCRHGVLPALISVLLSLAPAHAARAPLAAISVNGQGESNININAGTIQLEQFVLRQPPDTVIRAARASGSGVTAGNYDSSSWVLTGKVHIEHQGSVLDANSAKVVFGERMVRLIEVRDTPARFSHPTKVEGQRYQGRAETISFDGVKRRVRFTGHPTYTFGLNEGSSDKPMLYDLDNGVLSSENDAKNPDGRVRLTIRPGEKPSVTVEGASTIWNVNEGTIQFEQFVLHQAPDTLIRAAKASGSGVSASNNDNSSWALGGQVHVEYQATVMDADSAKVAFANRVVRSVEVRGAPALFSHPTKVAGRNFQGRADTVAFDSVKQQVRFDGHVWYSRSGAEGTSDKPIIYNVESGGLNSEQDGNPDSRIRMKIQPAEKQRIPTPRTPPRSTAQ